MIVLDTNVVSELMRPVVAAPVRQWLIAQNPSELWVTALTVAEVKFGIAVMPDGRRRQRYADLFELVLNEDLDGRVLDFTVGAAAHYAKLAAHRKAIGRPTQPFDGLIAAMCRDHGCILATRNIRDFEECDLELIDPWAG